MQQEQVRELSELRKLLDQINTVKNFQIQLAHQLVGEFLEKYEIWPSLQPVCLQIYSMRVADKKNLVSLEKKAQNEMQKKYASLLSRCRKQKIDIPEIFIDSYEQKILSSSGYTISRFMAITDILYFLKSKGFTSIVKKFVIFDKNNEISMCTFSPAYIEWEQKKEDLKNSLWYSFDQLNRLKKTKKGFNADFPFVEQDDYLWLREFQDVVLPVWNNINVADYKLHVKNLYEYTKQVFLNKEKKPDSYDKKTGVLVVNEAVLKFNPTDLRGKIIAMLFPRGRHCKKPVCFDVIYDKKIASEADYLWDQLDECGRAKIKKQIYEAYEGINERVSKKAKLDKFLVADDLTLFFL